MKEEKVIKKKVKKKEKKKKKEEKEEEKEKKEKKKEEKMDLRRMEFLERGWNYARVLRKDDMTMKAKKLLGQAEFVFDAGKYYILFRSRMGRSRIEMPVMIEKNLYEKIKDIARERGMSINQFICMLLREHEGIPDLKYVDCAKLRERRREKEKAKEEKMDACMRLYLEKDIRKKVEILSKELRVSMSDVIRAIIFQRIQCLQQKESKKKLIKES